MGRYGVEEFRGRDEEIMPELLDRVAGGGFVTTVCKEKGWPLSTVMYWAHSPKWRERYLTAREACGAVLGERVLVEAEEAARCKDYGRIHGLKVLVDALKWSATKHSPRLYGDRVDVTSGGERLGGVIALPAEKDPLLAGVEAANMVMRGALREARVLPPSSEVSAVEVTDGQG